MLEITEFPYITMQDKSMGVYMPKNKLNLFSQLVTNGQTDKITRQQLILH